ncbi:hypothetical protein M0R45_034996 [Rubus argutus]|uniref:Retrotransposon Copia-like N-terminal domain-containing protein n=1 Tax=Rubus argutus TaxID=59490 RepID=A0AAW1VUU6_RUBAR
MFTAPDSSSSSPQSSSIFDLLPNICNLVPIRLDHSNFSKWKYLMTTILKAYNLFRYVDGSINCSYVLYSEAEINQMNPEDQIMYREDQGVMALINATLSSSALDHAVGCFTSSQLWLKLDMSLDGKSACTVA